MIRILFNYTCNLYCSYCFEKQLWNNKEKLTPEDLIKILDFAGPNELVTIVGGEPTLHPQFSELLSVLRKYPNPKHLLTNGIFHSKFRDEISDTFQQVMFNLNEPPNYSDEYWQMAQDNIQAMATEDNPCKIQLGVNVFKPDQRFEYLIPFFKYFPIIKELRVSLAKPNNFANNNFVNLKQMKDLSTTFVNLVVLAVSYGFTAGLDCPLIPCIFDVEQIQFLSKYISDMRFSSCAGGYTFYPGLKIGHCFASFQDLYNLDQFKNLKEIEAAILQKEEPIAYDIASFDECEKCLFRLNHSCHGACLGFKMPKILQLEKK
jgi:organic radical activating enzyme